MGLSPLAFSGVSAYSEDFQKILERARTIASLPLERLKNESTDALQKKGLLSSLNIAVSKLQNSVSTLASIGASSALSASSSSTAVTVRSTGASQPATFTINEISKLAKAASETTASGYADNATAITSGAVKLYFGNSTYDITLTPDQNTLAGLRDAVNNLHLGVNASLITTGTGATPNYLTLNTTSTGATTLRLVDDPDGAASDLLTSTNQGQDAEFTVNGAPVKRSSNVVNNVLPGVTFTLTATSASPITITLATDRSQIATALQSFADNYNALVSEVGLQVGESAGLLSGDHIVREIQEDLRQLTSYRDTTGQIKSLVDLGITFSQDGQAKFDAATFDALPFASIQDATRFLGSATTGFGALQSKFKAIADPVAGLIKIQIDGYTAENTRVQSSITTFTERINRQQQALTQKLQLADALLGQMQSQQSVLDAAVKSLNFSVYGKQNQ
jgi:flagellar hook-associated protein 2